LGLPVATVLVLVNLVFTSRTLRYGVYGNDFWYPLALVGIRLDFLVELLNSSGRAAYVNHEINAEMSFFHFLIFTDLYFKAV
jgi:hypothetical protein